MKQPESQFGPPFLIFMPLMSGQPIDDETGDVVCRWRIEVGEHDDNIARCWKNRQSSIHPRSAAAVTKKPDSVRTGLVFKSVGVLAFGPRRTHLAAGEQLRVMHVKELVGAKRIG